MRAVGLRDFGGPEVLKLLELADPRPAPGEVLLRVTAAAVNPTDVTLRTGGNAAALRAAGPGPWVPGMDVAGEVIELGCSQNGGVAGAIQVGDFVAAAVVPSGAYGGYSELIAVPADSVVRVPEALTVAEAATLPMNGLTAAVIVAALGLPGGSTILVTGAAGVLGAYVVSLASLRGLTVIAEGRAGDAELLHRAGARWVVDRDLDLVAQVRACAPEGLDGVVDTANHGLGLSQLVRRGGGFAVVRGTQGSPATGVRLHRISVRDHVGAAPATAALQQAIDTGALQPRVAEAYPAAKAPDAHRAHATPGRRGRVVLTF